MGVTINWRLRSAVEFVTGDGTVFQAVTSPGSDYGGVYWGFVSRETGKWIYGSEREIGLDDFIARFQG